MSDVTMKTIAVPVVRLREEVAGAAAAEERLAAAAEDRAHVGALAGLEQHDDDQEEAGEHVEDGDDVVDHDVAHCYRSLELRRCE